MSKKRFSDRKSGHRVIFFLNVNRRKRHLSERFWKSFNILPADFFMLNSLSGRENSLVNTIVSH